MVNPKKPFGEIGVLVNVIIQRLKSKHLVCLSFLRWQIFWGNKRKYFPHILGQGIILKFLSFYFLQKQSYDNFLWNSAQKYVHVIHADW